MARRSGRTVTKPVRVSGKTYETLTELAESMHLPITAVVDRAVEELRRREFLLQTNASYARLQQSPKQWAEFQQEIEAWDATLEDGLV